MKKNLILAGLVLAGGLIAALPASAQSNTYNFDLNGTTGSATGTFHVILEKYNTATADLPGKQFRIQQVLSNIVSNVGTAQSGVSVAIEYFGKLNGLGPHLTVGAISGNAGLSPTISGAAPGGTLWTKLANNGVGVNKYDLFSSTIPANTAQGQIKKSGTNKFVMASTMIGNVKPAGVASVKVTVTGTGGLKWSAIENVATTNAPEAGSLALLLPGLIPVGIAMRKRNRKA